MIWHLNTCVNWCPKLRSSSQILLQVPVCWLKLYGNWAFSVAAPTLWEKTHRLLKILNPFKKHTCSRLLSQIDNSYLLKHII